MSNYSSSSVENFIKTIFQFELKEGVDTRSGTIARELGISHAAATDMARKLASRKLIAYEKYKELKLTSSGKKMAMNVLRKHRLWETFLHRVLGLDMSEIHQEAELLEHATSDFLLQKISEFLNDPKYDPHGDPIPNKLGEFDEETTYFSLSEANIDGNYEVIRLSSSEEEFFDFCKDHAIVLGTHLTVLKHYPKNKMIGIAIDQTNLLLNEELCNSIYVKPIKI